MSLHTKVTPTLDADPVDLGTSKLRSITIEAASYTPPVWVQFDGGPFDRVNALPWCCERVFQTLGVYSTQPSWAVPDVTKFTITVADAVIANDGSATTTVTVQGKDVDGNNLTESTGKTVALSISPNGAGHGSLSAVTDNANGTWTATVTSGTTEEQATISGTHDGDTITDTAIIGFGVYAAPDIWGPDDLANVTIAVGESLFKRAGTSIGLKSRNLASAATPTIVAAPDGIGHNAIDFDFSYGMATNQNFRLETAPTLTFNDEYFLRGRFYWTEGGWRYYGGKFEQYLAPVASGVQIVFYYVVALGQDHTSAGLQVVLTNGLGGVTVPYEQVLPGPVEIYEQTVYTYERHVKINSAYGVADGEIDLWLDGAKILHLGPDTGTGLAWLKDDGKTMDRNIALGDQVNGNSTVGMNPHAQWWDVAVSTQRVGP